MIFKFFAKTKSQDVENKLKVCFTGHRPKSLPWKYDEASADCMGFKKAMFAILEKAIQNNDKYFISGMALGVDMICAEIVISLKEKYADVILECAIPCANQSKRWSREQQLRYDRILSQADFRHYVSENDYSIGCMNNRNEYMVKKCDVVIAVWNGKPSGTGNTVDMARQFGKKVRIVDPNNPS